jgi:hydroxymethylpyrimidine pyrophosphatase-like HAD family hydrolase
MSKIDVFFDIDGCLINENYDFTVSPKLLTDKVRLLDEKLKVHLNSNRSLKSILKIWSQLNTNGFLIYENGLGVYNPLAGMQPCCVEQKFDRTKLIELLHQQGLETLFVDTDRLIRMPAEFSRLTGTVFCEESREYTATIYPRLMVGQIPQTDMYFIKKVKKVLDPIYSRDYNLSISEEWGNILLTPKNALKSRPMKTIAGDSRIASFGDQNADILMFKESGRGLIGCPKNAAQEVKDFVRDAGGFISDKDYTAACLDFLGYIGGFCE